MLLGFPDASICMLKVALFPSADVFAVVVHIALQSQLNKNKVICPEKIAVYGFLPYSTSEHESCIYLSDLCISDQGSGGTLSHASSAGAPCLEEGVRVN